MEQNWFDISLKVSVSDAEQAAFLIGECTEHGIYIEDYSRLEQETREIAHIDLIEKSLLEKDRESVVIHLYITADKNPTEEIALIAEKLKAAHIAFESAYTAIKQEDWANNWKQYFHQLEIGKKLLICPSWEQAENAHHRVVLYLEPGMAFGTGTHATTRLCLEVLENYVTPETRLLDVGCGSGILALSAMLLGAKCATGVDIDEKAVKTAVENAAKNGFHAPEIVFCEGDLTRRIRGTYNVIVANIVADVIVLLCKDIRRFMSEDGVLIVSGIIRESEGQVLEAFAQNNLLVTARAEKEGWLSFVLKKA